MKLRHLLPILAMLSAPALCAQVETITPEPEAVPEQPARDPDEPLVVVDEMPTFPGGQDALMKHLGLKIKYPEEAMEQGIQGTVFIAFVVERDGRINEVKVLRGIGGGCNEEAVRVVKSMPNWIPGKQNGKPVRVRYNLPIRYKLDQRAPQK